MTKSADLTPGGTYSVKTDTGSPAPGITIDPATGVIDLTAAGTTVGNYKVYYNIPADPGYNPADATSGCPKFEISTPLVLNNTCAVVTVDPTRTVCPGDVFDLHSYGTPPTGTTTYAWSLLNGGTFTSADPNPANITAPTTPGDYYYQLVVTVAGNPNVPVKTTVTVLPSPVATFTNLSPSVCTGSPVNVIIQGAPGDIVYYTVDNGTPIATPVLGSTGQYMITTPANGPYVFQIVSAEHQGTPNCKKLFTAADPNTTSTVTVGLPNATIMVQGNNPICSGSTTTIRISGTAGSEVSYKIGGVAQPVPQPIGSTGYADITTAVLTSNTTYELTNVSVPGSCSKTITGQQVTVTVNPLPEVTGFAASSALVCKGTLGGLVFTGTPGAEVTYSDGTATHIVTLGAGGTNTIPTPAAIQSSTTFTLVSISTVGGTPTCSNTNFPGLSPVTIGINTLPSTSSPLPVTVCEGGPDAVLSVSAGGAGLHYEWKLDNTGATVGTDSNTLDVTSILANNGNSYHCIVTDGCGQSAASLPATVTVTAKPVITMDPQGTPASICEGDTIDLTVSATPVTGATYQWYHDGTIITPASNASSATAHLIITGTAASASGDYYCEVTTCSSKSSQPFNIIVNPLPTVSIFKAAKASVCHNDNGTLEFTGTPDCKIIYQDQAGTIYPAVTTSAAGTATAVTPNITTAMTYTLISITMINTPFCSNTVLTPAVVTIDVNPDPSINITATATTICEGSGPITLSAGVVPGTGTPLFTYVWKKGGIATGTAGDSLVILPQAINSGSYTCTVTDACGRSKESLPIAITINVMPAITLQPSGSTICSKESIRLTVAASPAGPGLSYQWLYEGLAISIANNPTAGTSSLVIPNAQVSNSGSYECLVSNGMCSVKSSPAVITVNQAPVISKQPEKKIICLGDAYSLDIEVIGGSTVSYDWYKDGVLVQSSQDNTLAIDSTVPGTAEYYCIVSSTSCPKDQSNKVKVTVKALPIATIATINGGPDTTICEGVTSEVVITGTPNAVVTYTMNGGSQHTALLDAYGKKVLLTGMLYETVTYTLVMVKENDTPACYNTTFASSQVTIHVLPIMSPTLQDGYICVDQAGLPTREYTLDTGLKSADGYTFEWAYNGAVLVPAQTGETLVVGTGSLLVGKYKVTATNSAGCKTYAEAEVKESSPPTGITVNISGFFAENATVVGTATPLPTDNYVYRLDDGPYQQSPVFQGVAPGEHVIYAWDTQFCGTESSVPFSVIGYPRFFTPNGDGINDSWKIDDDSFNSISNARIYIFDRFGKLIKEISTVGDGWDGTFNSTPLPADDYWFSIKYEEQGMSKEFKAHFALKR